MFLGINEGCRQPAIPYGDVRMRAEVNLMAAHEVAGLFRHGMEGDAMSRSMLDADATIASFPKMIDTLAEGCVTIGKVCKRGGKGEKEEIGVRKMWVSGEAIR
jgi:hypothetical protein